MRPFSRSLAIMLPWLLFACHSSPRLDKSFDQIRSLVQGKTAAEIQAILGPPDSRQLMLLGDERWIWWDYTFLGGQDYSPQIRGQVVHLQITFTNPSLSGRNRPPYSQWRIDDPSSVSYLLREPAPLTGSF